MYSAHSDAAAASLNLNPSQLRHCLYTYIHYTLSPAFPRIRLSDSSPSTPENGGNDELVVTLKKENVMLKKENAEQKATIALLESKLAAKDAGIVVLYDGK